MTLRLRALALAASVAALGLAGCGGSSSSSASGTTSGGAGGSLTPPRAAQSLSAWVSSFRQAVASGSCAQLRVAYPDAVNCQGVLAGYKSAHLTGSAQFGTGALVDFSGTSARSPQGTLSRLTMFLVVGPSGRWEGIDSQGLGHATVGTTAASVAPFQATAARSYAAVAARNCATAYHYSLTAASQSDWCSGFQGSPVVAVIAANPHAKMVALGGTADVQFFGFFVTLPKSLANQFQQGNTKGYLTLAVAKVPAGVPASAPYLVEAEQPGPPPS